METQEQELSIGSFPGKERPPVPAGSYEAVYQGFRVFMDKTPWGEKKSVKLSFKIASGPLTDTNVYYKGSMFKLDNGDYIIGDKSELAERIRAISGGGKVLGEQHKGTRVIVGVNNKTSKKTGAPYDFVDTVLQVPGGAPAPRPAQVATSSSPATVAVATNGASAAVATPPKSDNLLDDLADLSDFEEMGK